MEKVKYDIIFADKKVQLTLEKLKTSKTEDKKLYDFLVRAFEDLEKNALLILNTYINKIKKK